MECIVKLVNSTGNSTIVHFCYKMSSMVRNNVEWNNVMIKETSSGSMFGGAVRALATKKTNLDRDIHLSW